jgi:hypothetical protein
LFKSDSKARASALRRAMMKEAIGLKPRTKSDYLKHIAKIEPAFATLPLTALMRVPLATFGVA